MRELLWAGDSSPARGRKNIHGVNYPWGFMPLCVPWSRQVVARVHRQPNRCLQSISAWLGCMLERIARALRGLASKYLHWKNRRNNDSRLWMAYLGAFKPECGLNSALRSVWKAKVGSCHLRHRWPWSTSRGKPMKEPQAMSVAAVFVIQ